MTIDYDTEISPNLVADYSAIDRALPFTKQIIKEIVNLGLESRIHTIEIDDDELNTQQIDRLYLRDSKVGGNRCYLFVNLEYGADEACVGFGELQHSGGEPTWNDRFYQQTMFNAALIANQIQNTLK